MDLEQALKEYENVFLFQTSEGRVLFHLLDYHDYKTIKHVMTNYPEFKFDLEDRVWDRCVIEHTFHNGKDFLPAGIATTVSQLVVLFSAPHNVQEINEDLKEARLTLNDAIEQAILTICEAFPSYLPENLEKMPWGTIIKRLAQAERILAKDFEFQDTASQEKDDSDKIFKDLDDFSDRNPALDFNRLNKEIAEA